MLEARNDVDRPSVQEVLPIREKHRRRSGEIAAVRAGPRHGAAEARLAARARPRRAPGPSPSAGQIRARWPTSSGPVSWCGRRAATPARLPPVGRGSLPVDSATRSDRTAPPDASVDLTAAPARTIADESTRFLRAPQRDGRRVSRPRSRPARWRTHACRPQRPTAAVDRRSSRQVQCPAAARLPQDE